ncbi:hypothetical protein MJO28_005132 [Puccinia striiformis f. sp. tritici]|uniref:Uncharacterized protein n=1 Tax=Puccinia striiformis f. sp. tritici TaxID=168172 RepID=A0ACC0EL30_9BASI|nr:hypothetical protein MJO28_005132 [Puccinia striiformis f. sp. tritici]
MAEQAAASTTTQAYPHPPSSPSSTASSESDEDTPGAEPPRRGDDRNLRINPLILHQPTEPALATPSSKLGSHPWPFNSLSPRLQLNTPVIESSTTTTATVSINTTIQTSISSKLPHEILIQILRSLSSTSDLRRALLVCKAWCQCGIELLWHKPTFPSTSCLIKMLVSLASKTQTFPYIKFIRRLNFSGIADHMTDHILLRLVNCTRLERLTLSGCNAITDDSIIKILKNSKDLVALDLSDCKLITDNCIHAVGTHSKFLQGLNLSGCKSMTDTGLQSLKNCKALRRLKLKYCEKITDAALITVATSCPLLLEVDLVGCRLITDASLWMLWKHSSHLRELSLSGCTEISDGGFPNPANCNIGADGISHPILEEIEPSASTEENNNSHQQHEIDHHHTLIPHHQYDSSAYDFISSLTNNHRRLDESVMHFDHIRFLDLTSLAKLTDISLDGIIKQMPRIRNLVLAKCVGLTDEALNSICGLGKYLHYLHLGHVSSLTDRAVIRVARSCTRLRYIDLACCNNLTDMSVFELAQCLPRLKRIGLVRVTNITDQSVYTLVERTSLERIHLSYCDNITVGAIHWLLQRLHRLTHLSLTGVPAFRRTDLQAWCRAPPKDFNAHQRQAFCVYSGKGVNELRYYLAALYLSITSTHNRSRIGGIGTSSNNSSIGEDEGSNNMTLSAAPIGPNLSVFNSMPDPRTMAAAMAAARQQTNPQLYGLSNHNRRRELRLPERGGRVALSDFLHQGGSHNHGPSTVNSAIISDNGTLLSLPDLPRHPASRMFFQINNDNLGVHSVGGVNDRSVTHYDEPTSERLLNHTNSNLRMMMQVDHQQQQQSMVGSSSQLLHTSDQNNNVDDHLDGIVPFEMESSEAQDSLRSPIPLYPLPNTSTSNRRTTGPSYGIRERSLAEHNQQLNGVPSAGINGIHRLPSNNLVTPEGTSLHTQHRTITGPNESSSLRIPHHSIIRRRSDVDMNNGTVSSTIRRTHHHQHHHSDHIGDRAGPINPLITDTSSTTLLSPSRLLVNSSPSSSSNTVTNGMGLLRSRSNGNHLDQFADTLDRNDSNSPPIDVEDDERPPP